MDLADFRALDSHREIEVSVIYDKENKELMEYYFRFSNLAKIARNKELIHVWIIRHSNPAVQSRFMLIMDHEQEWKLCTGISTICEYDIWVRYGAELQDVATSLSVECQKPPTMRITMPRPWYATLWPWSSTENGNYGLIPEKTE